MNKIFYYSVLAFAFTLPLSRALVSFFVMFIPLLWILQGNFHHKYFQIRQSRFLTALSLFLLLSALSILWSDNMAIALDHIRLDAYFLTLFAIATTIKKEQINRVITFFLSGMFVSESIAYGVFFDLWHFKHATHFNPSPFMFWIDYSVFMAFTSILLLNRIFSSAYSKKEKLFFALFFMTVTGNLFLAQGRTGQVALIVALLVLVYLHFKLSWRSLIMSLLLIGGIFSIGYNISHTFQVKSQEAIVDIQDISHMNLNGSWGIRVAFWMTTYDIVKDHPLFGVGLGDYVDETKRTVEGPKYSFLSESTRNFMANMHPHNQYLMVALQMGLVGVSLFLYMFFQILKFQINDKEIKNLSILFMVIFSISCFADPLLRKQFTIGIFILFIGLFASFSIKEKE
jgi:O-antigen ligase